MSWLNVGAALVAGVMGNKSKDKTDRTNDRRQAETNRLNLAEAARVRKFNKKEASKSRIVGMRADLRAFRLNQAEVKAQRAFDRQESDRAFRRDKKAVKKQREWSADQAQTEREWNAQQSRIARKFNKAETQKERDWNERTALEAEQRGRDYAIEDREDYRAYSNPAAVRARMEAAGINPLSGFVDSSTDYVPGGTAFAPASAGATQTTAAAGAGVAGTTAPVYSPARSALATLQNTAAGVAQGVAAQIGTAFASHSNFAGESIQAAASAFTQGKQAEAEQALRETELELEGQRVAALIEESKRPIRGGIYSGTTRTVYQSAAGSAAGGSMRTANGAPPLGGRDPWINDRDMDIMPMSDGPGITRITNPLTGGVPIYVPGADGEPWGIDEVLTATIFGVPQVPAASLEKRYGKPSDIGPRVMRQAGDYWEDKWAEKFAVPELPFNLPNLGRNPNSRASKRGR